MDSNPNVAGLSIVFDQYGIRPEALGVFYLAGGPVQKS
jgi:hypothetical protein